MTMDCAHPTHSFKIGEMADDNGNRFLFIEAECVSCKEPMQFANTFLGAPDPNKVVMSPNNAALFIPFHYEANINEKIDA